MDHSPVLACAARVKYATRLRFLLLIALLVSAPSFSQTGPVGHWKFDEGSGTAPQDSSGNANHCTMSPAPTWTSGRVNGALSFDGVDDTVNCGAGSTLGTLPAITVSAWVNLASAGEGGFGRIVQKGNGGSNPTAGWRLVSQTNNRLEFSVDHATSDVGRVSVTGAFAWNTWTHVVATWSGTTNMTDVKLYVNGAEVSGYSNGGNGSGARNSDNAAALRIGNHELGSGTVNGKIDEVRVYDRVLSLAEIQALADATAPSAPTGLTATAASSSQINLSWTASTDNVGVTQYLIERCQGASCANFAQVATASGTSYEDTGLTASTTYRYQVRATDTNTNLSGYSSIASASTPADADTQPPAAPTGLTATAASSTQVDLSWTASTDNVGVTGYLVERCVGASCTTFAQIATATATTYSDTGAAPSTTYRYQVRATDAANNLSGYSNIANATTPADAQAPSAPSGLTATAVSSTQIDLSWTAATDNIAVTGYLVERCLGASCTTFAQIATPTTTSYSDMGLTPSTAYRYRVRATDAANNLSNYSSIGSATTQADTQAPTIPTGLSATATSSTQINLSWTASSDDVGVTGYLVERCTGASCTNFSQIATPTGTTYSDTGLTSSTSYSYRVRATDAANNLSGYSSVASATTQAASTGAVGHWKFDEGTGTTPQDSSGNANHCTMSPVPAWTSGRVNGALSFDGVDDTVNCGSGSALGTLAQFTVSAWINLATAGEGGFGRIVQKGNGGSNPTAGWRLVSQTNNRIELSVDHATADVGRTSVTGAFAWNTWAHVAATWAGTTAMTDVKIYINGVEVSYSNGGNGSGDRNSDNAAALRIGNHELGSGTVNGKIDDVRVYDRVLSLTEIQVLADATAPSAPTGLTATPASSSQINLSWTASSDNVGVTNYLIERCQGASCTNFAQVATATGASYEDTGLTASTTYRYQVRAIDANTNLSGYSSIASATTQSGGGGDTQAPTTPSGLAATATSSSQIDLSWTASTDNVAVTGYLLERCQGTSCTNFTQIDTPTGTSDSDTGLTASTTYRYRVRATDAASNLSGYSSIASATTQAADTQPPSAPTGLTGTAASSNQINLSWTVSTDNVGVTGYLVERCQGTSCTNFAQIDTSIVTNYSNTGLAAFTTYRYRVRATDDAGNLGGYSNIVSVTTPTGSGGSGSVIYSYDALGRVIQVTEPDGSSLQYTYDASGNVTSITRTGGQ